MIDQIAEGNLNLADLSPVTGQGKGGGALSNTLLFKRNQTRKLFAEAVRQMMRESVMIRSETPRLVEKELEKMSRSELRLLFHPNAVGRILYTIAVPAYHGLGDSHARARVVQSLIEVRIAMERFHRIESRLPGDLGELVPDYLDGVPVDPFDGEPIRYDPAARVLYSIGRDLKDNGGVAKKEGALLDRDEIVIPLPERIAGK